MRQQVERDKKRVHGEIDHLKSLIHPHIIKVLSCYQGFHDSSLTICVLLFSSGEHKLGLLLQQMGALFPLAPERINARSKIHKWFHCLASALAYMHSRGIRHENVKPSNIVYLHDTVYFMDFSTSRRLEFSNVTSTATLAAASRLFATPEAMHDGSDNLQRHGSKTDVVSLGLVFLEKYTVCCDRSIDELHQHLFGINTVVKQYHRAIHKLKDFTISDPMPNGVYIDCIQSTLQLERTNRSSAAEVNHAMMLRGDVSVRLNCPCHVRFKA